MFKRMTFALMLVFGALSAAQAGEVLLENTIPSGDLFLQPPALTGAAPVFGIAGGVVIADAFTAPVTAALYQINVVVQYQDFPSAGVTGTSPMLLTLLTDSGNSPGTPIESWTVPLSPSDTSLIIVTVNSVTDPLLLAGDQYWVSEVPADPVHTGIGWGLASGIELPIAGSETGMNSGWMATDLNIANEFSVSGTATVPEPGTFGIGALVLLSMLASLRRKH